MDAYVPRSLIGEVLTSRALSLVRGRDGRDPDAALVGGIRELVGVAADLGLTDLAGRLGKLANIASQGHCRDLERAALVCLSEVK